MTDLATLTIRVDATGALRVVDQFGNATEQAAKQGDRLAESAKRAGAVIGGALVTALALAAKETADSQREQAQLEAALRSTAGASGQTIDSLNEQAAALRTLTAATGGEIAEAQALLLTFTKISGDVFPRATATVLDMAQALGTDARGAAIQLGKALNDPILGVTALAKAGVQFNDAQKKVIADLVETNRLAEAQGIILRELETQVGGSAAAYRNTLGGALTAVRESFVELLDLGNGPRMQGFIENVNILADSMGIFATQSALAFARSDAALQRNNLRVGGFLMGATRGMFGSGIAGQAAADLGRSENDIIALETLLAEQRAGLYAGITGRRAAGTGGGPAGLGAGDGAGLAAAAAVSDDARRALDAVIQQHYRDSAEAFAFRLDLIDQERAAWQNVAPLLEGGNEAVINFGAVVAGLPEQVSETQRVLTEQLQLSVGRFASDAISGTASVRDLWRNFTDLGRDAIGQVFAKEFMDRIGSQVAGAIGDRIGNLGLGGTAALGVVGVLISAIQNQGERAKQLAAAMAESARSIELFARRAGEGDLSEEQLALRRLTDERDALARQTLGAAGLTRWATDYDGDLDGLIADLEYFVSRQSGPVRTAMQAVIDQLLGLDAAYDANAEAIRENIEALEAQARARQAASLTAFSDSLLLSGQSTLSPTAQLTEARRQYEAILGLAQGGDASAIDSLPETARTLLDASRAVFASGARYADEFARVQEDVAAVIERLTNVEDFEPASEGSILYVGDQIQVMYEGLAEEAQAQLAVQQEGFQAVTGALLEMREELSQQLRRLSLVIEEQ